MKRTITLLAASLVGASGLASVAYAQDAALYGRVVSGIYYSDMEGSGTTWDLGSVDAGDLNSGDKLWSRIGVRASHDLGNGMTGGLHLEKRLDNFRTRHQNVWLGGPFGRLTLGQQGSPFYGAVTWDGANLFGGAFDPGSRQTGVTFATSIEGPFNVSAMVRDDDSGDGGQGNGLDNYEFAADFKLGEAFTLSGGYQNVDGTADSMGGSVGGSVAGLSVDVGYVRRDPDTGATTTTYGGHVGYAGAYGQYGKTQNGSEDYYWLVGYGHLLGPNTRLIVEYRNHDDDSKADIGALALRVDF